MKHSIYIATVLLLVSTTSAASQTSSQGNPGFFGASHPLHQAEVVYDNLAVSFGVSNASEVAEERLAEANQAAFQGKENAQERALNQYNKIAEKARNLGNNQDIQGLLQQVQQRTPDNASTGLKNALENAGNISEKIAGNVMPETEGNNPSGQNGDAGGDPVEKAKQLLQ